MNLMRGAAGAVALCVLMAESALADRKGGAIGDQGAIQPVRPLTALISINKQRLYVYDANGLVVQSRVSTGSSGYDTPKGIYSIIHKKVDHESNLYEGAPMPHMQRLLWSGIALHGGVVPRYPASHGCVRLPYDFAESFYAMTKLNDRVIIAPDVRAPVSVSHPLLFSALPFDSEALALARNPAQGELQLAVITDGERGSFARRPGRTLEQVIAERNDERKRLFSAEERANSELAAAKARIASSEAAVKYMQDMLKKARAEERSLAKAVSRAAGPASAARDSLNNVTERHEAGRKSLRADRLMAIEAHVAEAREKHAQASAIYEEAKAAHATAKSAVAGYERMLADAIANTKLAKSELTLRIAEEEAARAARESFQLWDRNFPKPLSIFISAKTRMISLRQGMEPLAEGPVTIAEPGKPLGTYLFTATGWQDDSRTGLNWNVVAVSERGEISRPRGRDSDAEFLPPPTNAAEAQAALDRILTIPPHVAEKIAELVKPGSTFIISDYDMSRSETGKGTDFIVQMPEVIAPKWTPELLAMRRNGGQPDDFAFYDPVVGGPIPPGKLQYAQPFGLGKGAPQEPAKEEIYKPNPRWYRPSLSRQFGYNFD